MMRKRIKQLFVFTVSALLLLSSVTVFAAQNAPTVKRLSGSNRYATSASVALNGWTQSDYAILACGEDFPDALSAAPLAEKYNAPILLTETDSIPTETLNAIQQLKVKSIFIVGGTGIVSSAVEQQLTSLGITVTRISGQDRYETAVKIAEQLNNVTEIAVVTGENFPDALSISPIAAKMNMPIILVQHNAIPKVVTNYINSHKLTKTYVIGAGTSLDNTILTGLSNTELITGNDKYQLNLNVIDKFKSDLNFSTIYLATGENFADALSGSILAGKNSNPLVLVGNDPTTEKDYFAKNFSSISNINVLGGAGAVTDEVVSRLIGTSAASTLPTTSTVDSIEIVSTNLTETGANTAAFKYKILDKSGTDITSTVPASDINGIAWIGAASTPITLDPLTGTGTFTYSSSTADKNVTIQMYCTNGITATSSFLGSTDSTSVTDKKVAGIKFVTYNITKTGTNTGTFKFQLLNKEGDDITKSIPASEIDASVSGGQAITLDPSTETGTITFDSSNDYEENIVTLSDNVTNVSNQIDLPPFNPKTNIDSSSSKLSKIVVLSSSLSITPKSDGTPGNGYATFKAYDQNGVDITSLPIMNNVKFTCDSATVLAMNGLITLTPNTGVNLSALKSVVITATDPSSGNSISVKIPIGQ